MPKHLTTTLLAILSVSLAACGGGYYEEEVYYEDRYYEEEHYYADDHHDAPTLYNFHVIDTYETNTEFDTQTNLALSPYVNTGLFELFWDTDSFDDYVVEFLFNTQATPVGARTVSTQWCDPSRNCHDQQYQFCEYTANLYLACELSNGDYQSRYIGNALATIPQDAYLILQVCDSNYFFCEYQARSVSME